MAPVTLNDFTLNIDVDGFYEMFWGNAQWFEEFLINKLKDLSVSVGDWAPSPEQPNAHTRTVKSYHPAKISFPGLPSHAEVSIYSDSMLIYSVIICFVLLLSVLESSDY